MSKSKKLIDRVQGYTMDNIPKGPRLTRSTKNNKRAIDTLEQKLNQISKNQKDGIYSPNAQPVFMGSSYSPIGSRNTGHRIIPNDGGISPTPKRRRRNDNEIETRNKINKLPILPRSKNNNSSINSSREDNADTRLIHSSPIRKKNVKFADKLEASLNNNSNIRSSPIRKPPHYPIKSILRRTNYAMNDSPPRKPRSLIVAEEEDNSTVNYSGELAAFWSAGNIHEMSDPNNFDEYKDFIMKGLEYLEKESCPRRYEIYGTFNKIIPVTPVHIVANTIKDRKSSLNDKKIIFLNENLDRLMPIVTRDMKSVSAKEDEHFVLNSIFVSRVYHQCIRLITLLLSNDLIVAALIRNEYYIKIVYGIFQDTYKIFRDVKITKQVLSENLTFLKKEQISVKLFTSNQKARLVSILSEMKEFQSNGIIMEKLSLIKALLQRYPDEMLDQICDWFPREILFRILMSTSSASQEILVMSTMILRDVVMMRTDKFLKDDSFFRCIEIDSPKFTIPRDVIERLVKQNSQIYEDETYTWGSLIRLQSKFLLTERQFETVSELWSLMVKLLYDQKCDSISQLRFSREQFSEWLDLNRIFFLNANNQMVIRFLIDMWQNVILVLWNSTFSLPSSAKLVTEIVNIIQTPFQRLISSKRLEYIFGALEPLLLKLYSFFWKASYSEDNHSLMRFNTWSKVMGEILLLCFRSGVSSTQVLVTKLIHRALDLDYRQPSTHPLEINTLRGVAQLPSTLEDMTCLSPIFYSQTFHMMLQLLDECIQVTADSSIYKADCEVPLPFAPRKTFDIPFLMECSRVVLGGSSRIRKTITLNEIGSFLSSLTLLFSDALFCDYSADYMINYLLQIKSLLPNKKAVDLCFILFKTLFQMYTKKGRQYIVIYAFTCIDMPSIAKRVCAHIDQVTITEKGDPATLFMMLKVLSLCYKDFYFENTVDLIFDKKNQLSYKYYNMLSLLHMEKWDSPYIRYFFDCYCRLNKSEFNSNLFSILDEIVKENFDLFYSLIEVLKSHNLGGEIRKLIIRHMSMVDTVKFLELDLLPNYAPKNIRTNIIMNLNEMDIDEQSRIIKIYLYQDADLLLKSGTVGIENYIKSKTVFSMDERTALRDILIECHDRQMFTVGNRLINILLSKQINSVVEEFFRKYQKEDDIFFNIDTLSAIVSKINACREDGLQILTGIIQKGDEEIDFIILDNILKQDNTIIFKPCVNTLFAIFLNEPSPDNNRNYKHLFETFKKWIKLILTADKNTQIIFMEGFGESLSRYPINKDNAKYVKQFIDQLEFGKKFRDLESARNIQDIFNNWDSLKNSIPRTESSNHSGSTILTPGGLNDSGNDKKLHPVEKNIIPSSVKDTKDSYTSLISNSETISSIDDVDLKITPNKQIESSENPSMLPEVSVGSNKDLSQQYLAKSTQLEQKKDNTSDMISNEINTIIIEHKSPSREKLTKQYKNENILENENLDEEKEFIKKMESTNEREDHENEENEEMFTLKDGYLQTKYPKLNSTTDTKAHSDSENDESDDPDVKSESEEEMIKMSDTINAILSPVTSAEKKAELRTAETEVNTGISTRLDNVDAVVNPDSSNIVISPIMGVSLDTTPDENTINNSLINGIHTQKEVSSASIDLMVKLEDPENISSLSGNDKEHPIAIVLDSDSDSLDDIENLDASKNMQDDLVNADSAVTQEVMPLNHDLAKRETEDTAKLMDKESLGNSTNPNDKIDTSDNELNQDDENLGTSANPEDDIMEKKFTAVKDEVVKKITQLPQIQSDDFFRVQDDNEPDMDEDENKSNSNKMPMSIKIPIFNFRKRVAPTIPLNRYSPKRRSLRYANSNTVINVNIPKTVRRPASPEPIIRHPTMNEGFSNDLVLSDLSGHDSVTSVASLTDRLPTKKARKLVSRIRSISRNDLAFLSAAERKTMRMEMLDFLMKLEHESTND